MTKTIFKDIDQSTTCYEFLKTASLVVPFKGVSFVEVPEILPAKVFSKFVFSEGVQVDNFEFYLCNSVRRSMRETMRNSDNFLIESKSVDNHEVIERFGIEVFTRVPIYIDCNTIVGILYFVQDKPIEDSREELFSLITAIGATFSQLYFKEFGCDLPGRYAEINLLKKMVDSNHSLISSVIHDLSNPLTIIYFEAQKAQMNQGKDISKSLDNIETSIDEIYKLIDRTKKFFSKNKEKEDLESLSVKSVVDFISVEYKAQLEEKNIELESSGLDVEFIAFKNTFLHTIFGSIISNSIRYSQQGSKIKIFGKVIENKVQIIVEDLGGGFPEDVLCNLESNFKSHPVPSTTGDIGSGMGLVLAKSYLQIMNGELEIENIENGSRIILKMSK